MPINKTEPMLRKSFIRKPGSRKSGEFIYTEIRRGG
jgi:hypothetical protein